MWINHCKQHFYYYIFYANSSKTSFQTDERADFQVTPKANFGKNIFNAKKEKNSEFVYPKKYSPTDALTPRKSMEDPVSSDYLVELNKVCASWTGSDVPAAMTLKNISLRIRKGKLCAIIGPVGSGKVMTILYICKHIVFADY